MFSSSTEPQLKWSISHATAGADVTGDCPAIDFTLA